MNEEAIFLGKGYMIVFYDIWDVITTIGGGFLETFCPTLNGIGNAGNPISLWRASKPGGLIDQGIGGVFVWMIFR